MKILENKKLWAFVGGMITTEILKSNIIHKAAVRTVAESMKVQKKLSACAQDIKQEATDLCYDEILNSVKEDFDNETSEYEN